MRERVEGKETGRRRRFSIIVFRNCFHTRNWGHLTLFSALCSLAAEHPVPLEGREHVAEERRRADGGDATTVAAERRRDDSREHLFPSPPSSSGGARKASFVYAAAPRKESCCREREYKRDTSVGT